MSLGGGHFLLQTAKCPKQPLLLPKPVLLQRGSSVIQSASKMISLSGILVVRKGQYSPKCVLGSFFAINGKNTYKNIITVQ